MSEDHIMSNHRSVARSVEFSPGLALSASHDEERDLSVNSQPNEVRPVWDEATRRFWCQTAVNAYDIPDGRTWSLDFRVALASHHPEAVKRTATPAGSPIEAVATPCRNHADTDGLQREAYETPPPSPSRRSRRPIWRDIPRLELSPETPPKRQYHGMNRAARAAHTKALLTMPQKAGISAIVQGHEIAFYRFEGRVFAVAARCPHQGGNLCEGEVGDIEDVAGKHCYVTCPVHKMQFDLTTGMVLDGDCPPLQTYDIRITHVDAAKKVAWVEVGFESLAAEYFAAGDGHF